MAEVFCLEQYTILPYTLRSFHMKQRNRKQKVRQTGPWVFSILVFCLASAVLLVPLLARAEVDPAARHKQLTLIIEKELKLRKDSLARYQPYVHWVRLDHDQYVDAIVILKQQQSSCALQPTCLGFIIQGRSDGFHVLSTFLPNQHSLYLAPLNSSSSPRTLYYSDDGEDYDQIEFSDGRYRIAKRGLSIGRVRQQAYWQITEQQFDEIVIQTTEVEKLGQAPAGAPILVKVPDPPKSLWDQPNKEMRDILQLGYDTAMKLEKGLRDYFALLAQRQVLSHSITIELIACGDWITRVPLVNQRDRSSRYVVGCLELLGILTSKKIDITTQRDTLIYLLVGSFGQALAIQTHAIDLLLSQVRDPDSKLTPEERVILEAQIISTQPWNIFYLVGMLAAEGTKDIVKATGPNLYFRIVDRIASKTRGEYNSVLIDTQARYTATYCSKLIKSTGANDFLNASYQDYLDLNEDELRQVPKDKRREGFFNSHTNQMYLNLGNGQKLCQYFGEVLLNRALF